MSALAIAVIRDVQPKGLSFQATFNPTSLKMALSNKLQDEEQAAPGGKAMKGQGKAQQTTRVSTTKLDVELIVDTTDTGGDVREDKEKGTDLLKKLATASEGDHPSPPQVEFRWGRFRFIGLIESLNETLDFWSAEGVPLRATIQLSIAGKGADTIEAGEGAKLNEFKETAIVQAPAGGRGTTDVASAAGNSGAGRALAAANGMASMRASAGASVAVSAKIELKVAARFDLSASAGASAGFGAGASASAGVGASAGIGGGAGIGLSAGASAGAGIGVGASAGIGVGASAGIGIGGSASVSFGASATAGVSASAGAFAGLGSSKTASVSLPMNPARLLPPPLPSSGPMSVDVTGRSTSSGPGGLNARLGAQASAGVSIG